LFIPKLDPTGSNCVICSKHFEFALTTWNMWGHFDGMTLRPPHLQPATQSQQEELDEWDKDKCTALYMLTQKLTDSAIVQIPKFATCVQCWKLVEDEFIRKGLFAHSDLHQSFMEMRCPHSANICQWLTDLGTKREELVMDSVLITDAEYHQVILSSILDWLRTYATGIQVSISVRDLLFEIEPDVLGQMVSEETD